MENNMDNNYEVDNSRELLQQQRADYGWTSKPTHSGACHGEFYGEWRWNTNRSEWIHSNMWVELQSS